MRGMDKTATPGAARPGAARRKVACAVLAATGLLAAAGAANAQDRGVTQVLIDQSSVIERFAPPPARGTLDLDASDLRRELPEDEAAARTFTLADVELEGVTLLPSATFERLWADRLGRETSLAEVYAWAGAIEAIYREAGWFALVAVPEQDLADGRIRLVVFDRAYIESVEIVGELPGMERRLAPYIRRLVALRPLPVAELERVLLLIADLAGMDVEAEITKPERPGDGGALRLELALTPLQGQVMLDNRGSDETGPLQLSGVTQAADLLGLFETTTLTLVTALPTPREMVFLQAGQELPLGSDGLRLGYSAGYLEAHPGGDLEGLDVEVSTVVSDVFLSYPLLRSLESSLVARLDFNTSDEAVDVQAETASRDRYRWLELGFAGDRETAFGPASLELSLLQGLDVMNATGAEDRPARAGAANDFRVLTGQGSFASSLSERVTLGVRAVGQLAFDPLPPTVQQSLGGDPFGRAFESGALAGDSGLAGSLELGLDDVLPLVPVPQSSAFAFVDYGALWNRDEEPGFRHASLGSAGVGLRAVLPGAIASEVTLAAPFADSEDVEDGGVRLFFSLAKAF